MKRLLLIALFVLLSTACSIFKEIGKSSENNIPVKEMSLMLNDSLRVPSLKNKETGVLTFTNLNNLNEAEPLGRYLQERLLYYLFNNGFRLRELRLGKQNKFIPRTGEINITRLKSELNDAGLSKLESIIVGTYIDAGNYYYVNVNLIELKNGLIRASGEIKIEKGKYLEKLVGLSDKKDNSTNVLERFPVSN